MALSNQGRKHVSKFHRKWISLLGTAFDANAFKVEFRWFRNPLTDKILEEDLNIKKIGYRVRILNKLKSGLLFLMLDSKLYVEKCKGNELHMYDKKNSIKEPCKCIIY